MGSDGAHALQAIKEAGCVDVVLPLGELAGRLMQAVSVPSER